MGVEARRLLVSECRIAGLSTCVIVDLVAELGLVWRARRDAELLDWVCRRAVGAGAKFQLVFVDRLGARLVHLWHGVTHDVLACWFQVDRSTISRAVTEVLPLLADCGCRIERGLRLRTLADVIAHLGASGQTALMDATEIRVRRPWAHRSGRSGYICGKSRINAMKARSPPANGDRCCSAAKSGPVRSLTSLRRMAPAWSISSPTVPTCTRRRQLLNLIG